MIIVNLIDKKRLVIPILLPPDFSENKIDCYAQRFPKITTFKIVRQ